MAKHAVLEQAHAASRREVDSARVQIASLERELDGIRRRVKGGERTERAALNSPTVTTGEITGIPQEVGGLGQGQADQEFVTIQQELISAKLSLAGVTPRGQVPTLERVGPTSP